MTKKTPLYDQHVKLGGKIVDFAGWMMPVQYKGVTEEHINVRKNVGLFDVSHMGIFEIKGRCATDFLNYLTPSSVDKMDDMQAQYSLLLKENATFVDDIIIYRLNSEHFYLVVNASNLEKDFNWIESRLKDGASLKNLSEELGLIAIQGPKTAQVLSKITDINIDGIKTFYMAAGSIAGFDNVLMARTGYTGEDGFEIFCRKTEMEKIWTALLAEGKEFGIQPIGLGARDTLRLEMKYSLYGHEINEETNALEAGLRWVIKFKKPCDFIGKDALLKIRNDGVKRRLVGFKMIDKGIPRHGYAAKSGGRDVGHVTSGTFSPSLQVPIGIAYLEAGISEIGTKFSVDIRGKERLAEVIETPFYQKS